MNLEFTGPIFYWRGPAPYYFVAVPEPESAALKSISKQVSYGWGVIPVTARIGKTRWETSLFPKNGGYVVPIKAWVRRDHGLAEGDEVMLSLETD